MYLAGFGLAEHLRARPRRDHVHAGALGLDRQRLDRRARSSICSRAGSTVSAAELMQVYESLRKARARRRTSRSPTGRVSGSRSRAARCRISVRSDARCSTWAAGVPPSRAVRRAVHDEGSAAAVKPGGRNDPRGQGGAGDLHAGNVMLIARRKMSTGYKLSGSAKGS